MEQGETSQAKPKEDTWRRLTATQPGTPVAKELPTTESKETTHSVETETQEPLTQTMAGDSDSPAEELDTESGVQMFLKNRNIEKPQRRAEIEVLARKAADKI